MKSQSFYVWRNLRFMCYISFLQNFFLFFSICPFSVSMEPIKAGCDAEKAAMEAAQQKENNSDNKNNGTIFIHNTWVKSCCSSCGKIFKWMKDAFNDQAAKILRGSSPYRCEISITTVNILVLCSLIVAFLDQAKYAFLTKDTDYALGVVLL